MRRGWALVLCVSLSASVLSGCNDDALAPEPQDYVDSFRQQRGDKVDVLWVVDNSGSMGEEQAKLADNFDQFINYFVTLELDFNMSIITTDLVDPLQQGRFQGTPKILRPDTPNLIDTFKTNVNVGTNGDGTEAGLEAARLALSEPLLSGENAGFLREDAYLVIIVVSDEDHYGSEGNAPPSPPASEYIQFFQDLKGPELFSLGAIAGDVPNGCQNSLGDAAPGTIYYDAANQVGGITESICEEDFGPVLSRLGEFIGGLVTAFPLSYWPVDDSVIVWVDGQQLPPGTTTWNYLSSVNAVQFASDAVPNECVEVRIEYVVASGQTIEETPPEDQNGFDQCPEPTPSGEFDLEGGSIQCAVTPPVDRPQRGFTLWLLLIGALGAAVMIRRTTRSA